MVIKGVQVPHWKPVEKAICSGNRDPKVVPAQLEGHPKDRFVVPQARFYMQING